MNQSMSNEMNLHGARGDFTPETEYPGENPYGHGLVGFDVKYIAHNGLLALLH
jgi:hypothetical protein